MNMSSEKFCLLQTNWIQTELNELNELIPDGLNPICSHTPFDSLLGLAQSLWNGSFH